MKTLPSSCHLFLVDSVSSMGVNECQGLAFWVSFFCSWAAAAAALSAKGVNFEVQALMFIKASLEDPHDVLKNWDDASVDPCSWTMVNCSPENLVIGLGTPGQNLSGTLSPSIGNLTNLEFVLLQNNTISGVIPAEIGKLSKLRTLDLSDNDFSGEIPASLGNLKVLMYLRFNNNSLSGALPQSLANLTQLTFMDMSYNNLSGPVLNFPERAFNIVGNPLICPTHLEQECYSTVPVPRTFYTNISQGVPISHNPKRHKVVIVIVSSLSTIVFVSIALGLFIWCSRRMLNRQMSLNANGNAPLVIARGGFSGVFPESSQYAYQFALANSVKNVVLYCDLQLTKDGAGICHSDYRLDNSTTISSVFPNGQKTYPVNGQQLQGWFSVDFTSDQLYNNVSLIQSIFSRPSIFDASLPISMVEDVVGFHPSQFWINVHSNTFFKDHNLDAVDYIASVLKQIVIDFISSPEVEFLKSVNGMLGRAKTKLIFQFSNMDDVEPSTNQTYRDLLTDLSTIKSFASGILVPKSYIWPVNEDQYLQPHTSLVTDAHGLGLEVYASDFSNDSPGSYNYSFDPTVEYLQFIDNSNFSVDGVLTDFPSTASEAISCLAHNNKSTRLGKGQALIITHNGASGIYAGSTDLAYQQAVEDGADVIDCSVQMSKDGVAFCLESADLMGHTTAVKTFMPQATLVPEIQKSNGIFSFDLSWSDIQSLKPELTSPLSESGMARNPAVKNEGKFMTLDDFLNFVKNSRVFGILINIENAAYLASKKGLGIVDVVSSALSNASFDKQPHKQVFIQSDDIQVLSAFKQNPGYTRVLTIEETISDASKPTVDEIKKFADVVDLPRSSIVTDTASFISGFTDVVKKMHAANISVHVSVLRNEYLAIAFDYSSDPIIEIATLVAGIGVDGIVTDFPATAVAYLRSPCSDVNAKLAYQILPIEPGALFALVPPEALPPAEAPAPALQVSDIQDPALPPVANLSEKSAAVAPPTTTPSSSQSTNVTNIALCLLVVMLSSMCLSYQ